MQYNIYRKITRKEIMEKIKYLIEKYKILIIIAIVVLLLLIGIIMNIKGKHTTKIDVLDDKYSGLENKNEDAKDNNNGEIGENKKGEVNEEYIKVDIKGLVDKPGVYEMKKDSRVIDVIYKAGGLSEGANTEYINLSKKITDEMIIIIYSNSDVEKFKETDKQVIYIEYECVCPDNKNDACITDKDTVNTNGVKNEEVNDNNKQEENNKIDDKISINTATLEELMTVKGIGESKAKSILEYRKQNGEFKSLEDIKNVSGIGESVYSKIKDYIKL